MMFWCQPVAQVGNFYWTPCVEPASNWKINGTWYIANQWWRTLRLGGSRIGYRAQKSLCVGMLGVFEYRLGCAFFYDIAQIHHTDTLAQIPNHREIMGNKQIG
jgi:hypothetical protein